MTIALAIHRQGEATPAIFDVVGESTGVAWQELARKRNLPFVARLMSFPEINPENVSGFITDFINLKYRLPEDEHARIEFVIQKLEELEKETGWTAHIG